MQKTDIYDTRTYRALFLLNMLSCGTYNKKEIINEFKKNNIDISKTSIVNYINKLKAFDIPIKTKNINGVDYFSLNKKTIKIDIEDIDAHVAQDVKKLLIIQKDYENIRKAIKLFYKFSLLTKNNETRLQLADFGYYSKINWELVKELKNHCKEKNIIELDYMLPSGGNKSISIHVDDIVVGSWSERLYLKGIFHMSDHFSQLPIDRIYMVKKVIKKNVRFDFETDVLTYKINKELMKTIELEEQEMCSGIENNLAVIKRPIDDDFSLIQRLLHFCPDLYYISDESIKNKIQEKLNILKDSYNDKEPE